MITVNGKPLHQVLDDHGGYKPNWQSPLLREMAKETKQQYNKLLNKEVEQIDKATD